MRHLNYNDQRALCRATRSRGGLYRAASGHDARATRTRWIPRDEDPATVERLIECGMVEPPPATGRWPDGAPLTDAGLRTRGRIVEHNQDEAIKQVADMARRLGDDDLASRVLELRFIDPGGGA